MKNRVSRLLLTAAALCAVAQTASAQVDTAAIAAQPPAGVEPLWPGDAIRLTFWREPALNGEYPIDETGRIVIPILGPRRVIGIAPEDLVNGLLTDYGRELADPSVGIALLRRIRILGAVNNPGLFHVDPTMTLADALALAGGTTKDANLSSIQLVRNGRDVRSGLSGDLLAVEMIRSGDQLMVEQRSWLSRNPGIIIGGLISAAALIITRAAFTSN